MNENIYDRKFGKNHKKKCNNPDILTCTFSEYQEADKCKRFMSDGEFNELVQFDNDIWNAAIEAAAALLEIDDEILPYTIEQVRKLKK